MTEPEITKDTFPDHKKVSTADLVKPLPAYLKEPANYKKVLKAIYEAGASKCNHSDILEWGNCVKCQRKLSDRANMMKKLGFTSGQQYLEWRKIHETIQKMPLPKYNS